MIKNKKKLCSISLCIIAFIVLLLIFLTTQYDIYELTPAVCSVVLGGETTPESFVEGQGTGTALANCYACAWVNDEGNLVLVLANRQLDTWRNSNEGLQILHTILGDESDLKIEFDKPLEGMDKVLFDGAVSCGLELSEDYTQIIEEPGERSIYAPWFINMSVTMQLFEGVPSEEIRVEYVQCDEDGKVLAQFVVWSQDGSSSPLP